MAAETKNGAVRLPQSAAEFYNSLKSQGNFAQFAAGPMTRKSTLPLEQQQMVNYAYPGLINGRPLNKVMIVLVGQSGAGKSTTINYLFNDQICETSTDTSITRAVTEYGKQLCASDEDMPSIIGALSFVDPPGALDVDQTKETLNLATITKFRQDHPDLQPRKGLLNASAKIRENVYPNLVLMVIHAADNRMRGPDSNLRKCLKALEKYKLLDTLYLNFMVVVTHAMTISKKKYKQETARITSLIQEAINVVLRIHDVKVVFVENEPEEYDLEKADDCDFYSLPDDQLSHYNLIKAMEKQFDQNGDVLGKLLCGWYFASDCPEKQNKANVLQSVEHTELTDAEREEALRVLANLNMQLSAEDDVVPPKFNFQFLGHGYCPRTESLKHTTVYSEKDTVRAKLIDTLYTIPKCFEIKEEIEDTFFSLTSETKEAYEHGRGASYGLTDEIKLVSLADPTYRWVKGSSNNYESVIRAVYEKRFINAQFSHPENHVKDELMQALNLLPRTYLEKNSVHFHEFFLKWGTHFIQEVWMGGHLAVDCPVKVSTYNDAEGMKILQKCQTAFHSIVSLEKRGTGYRHSFDGSADLEIQNCTLSVEGGDPMQITQLVQLSAVRFTDWAETIKWYPAELEYSFKLRPYYVLVKDAQRKKVLREATFQYLEGTMSQYVHPSPTSITYVKPTFDDGDESTPLKPAEVRAVLEARNSFYEGTFEPPKIRRNDVAKKMMDTAKLEAKESNGRCVVM